LRYLMNVKSSKTDCLNKIITIIIIEKILINKNG